jgi:hypothetical protein
MLWIDSTLGVILFSAGGGGWGGRHPSCFQHGRDAGPGCIRRLVNKTVLVSVVLHVFTKYTLSCAFTPKKPEQPDCESFDPNSKTTQFPNFSLKKHARFPQKHILSHSFQGMYYSQGFF